MLQSQNMVMTPAPTLVSAPAPIMAATHKGKTGGVKQGVKASTAPAPASKVANGKAVAITADKVMHHKAVPVKKKPK